MCRRGSGGHPRGIGASEDRLLVFIAAEAGAEVLNVEDIADAADGSSGEIEEHLLDGSGGVDGIAGGVTDEGPHNVVDAVTVGRGLAVNWRDFILRRIVGAECRPGLGGATIGLPAGPDAINERVVKPEERIVGREDGVHHVAADDVVPLVMHAGAAFQIAPEHPVGIKAGGRLVESFERVDVGLGGRPSIVWRAAAEDGIATDLERGMNTPAEGSGGPPGGSR